MSFPCSRSIRFSFSSLAPHSARTSPTAAHPWHHHQHRHLSLHTAASATASVAVLRCRASSHWASRSSRSRPQSKSPAANIIGIVSWNILGTVGRREHGTCLSLSVSVSLCPCACLCVWLSLCLSLCVCVSAYRHDGRLPTVLTASLTALCCAVYRLPVSRSHAR